MPAHFLREWQLEQFRAAASFPALVASSGTSAPSSCSVFAPRRVTARPLSPRPPQRVSCCQGS